MLGLGLRVGLGLGPGLGVRARVTARAKVRGWGSHLVREDTRVVTAVDAVVQQQGRRPLTQQHARAEARGDLVVVSGQ